MHVCVCMYCISILSIYSIQYIYAFHVGQHVAFVMSTGRSTKSQRQQHLKSLTFCFVNTGTNSGRYHSLQAAQVHKEIVSFF